MITMRARARMHPAAVKRPVEQANFKNLHHAAATIRQTAQRSIRKRKKPSTPGAPPHTQGGQLKKSILYDVDPAKQRAVIGPAAHLISHVAASHEHGRTEPANPAKNGPANWQVKLGGHGPLRKAKYGRGTRGSKYVVIKIRTSRQLAAVEKYHDTLPIGERGHIGPRTYPQRPFMGPALAVNESKIPRIWRGSVKT